MLYFSRHSLYLRCRHPTYSMMESSQTDSSISWSKCTHISQTDFGYVASFISQLTSQYTCNFSPCRGVKFWKAVYTVMLKPWRQSRSAFLYRLCTCNAWHSSQHNNIALITVALSDWRYVREFDWILPTELCRQSVWYNW
jgi:hypothetical protein